MIGKTNKLNVVSIFFKPLDISSENHTLKNKIKYMELTTKNVFLNVLFFGVMIR